MSVGASRLSSSEIVTGVVETRMRVEMINRIGRMRKATSGTLELPDLFNLDNPVLALSPSFVARFRFYQRYTGIPQTKISTFTVVIGTGAGK